VASSSAGYSVGATAGKQDTFEPRLERRDPLLKQIPPPKERFGSSDSTGKDHVWLSVTSESALSMFLSCLNPLDNFSQVGQL